MPLDSVDFNLQSLVGASNKSFDYLACGLTLVVSQLPDWEQMFVEPGYGLSCDPTSAESIAAAIEWLYAHPAERRTMGERGQQRILSDWNYDDQFQPVLDVLSHTTHSQTRCPKILPEHTRKAIGK
jgi:spore maturation protein CgeB